MTALSSSLRLKLGTTCLLVALADVFFYAEPSGWGSGAFALGQLAAFLFLQRQVLQSLAGKLVATLSVTLTADMMAEPGLLNMLSFSLSLLTLVMLQKRKKLSSAPLWLKDTGKFLSHVLKIWNHELFSVSSLLKKRRWDQRLKTVRRIGQIALPASLTLVFCLLFAEANPVLMQALQKFDWSLVLSLLSAWRWLFWLWSFAFIWAVLRPRFPLAKAAVATPDINLDRWVNRNSIIASLGLFNILFALQNALDLIYLWRQQPLPGGMSYAEYAHAGAYPLIVTALLAGAYVLITFGNSDGKYQSKIGRGLVYAWIAQNIFLVVSAIDRTLHYVDAYSLTYLRTSALIWMSLVAFGLLTLVARVALRRTNLWLININALALAAIVYVSCFMNYAGFIADYNVRHCREITGDGPALDVIYLQSLGWQAAPALHWFHDQPRTDAGRGPQLLAGAIARNLDADLAAEVKNHWQGWTVLRQLRLQETAGTVQP